ncbi:type II toxin-antitoxin system HicB family antitoxin [Nostoc sp. CHAB 5824]|nr:type II toxin-antitoxin system HicB family antitoxin [Nostoc sp. CHAB 5824]
MINLTNREFYVIIERDEDGYYVGEVPQLKACYSQGETIDELMVNIKQVIRPLAKIVLHSWGKGKG